MDLKERREVVVRSCCRMIETGMYQGIGHRASGNRKHRGSHSSAYIHIWMNRSPPTKRSWLQHSTAQHSKHEHERRRLQFTLVFKKQEGNIFEFKLYWFFLIPPLHRSLEMFSDIIFVHTASQPASQPDC